MLTTTTTTSADGPLPTTLHRVVVEGETIEFTLAGETHLGADHFPLVHQDDLVATTPWSHAGYTVAPFLPSDTFAELTEGFRLLVLELVRDALDVRDEDFTLERYHRFVSDDVHARVLAKKGRGWDIERFPIDVRLVEARIGEIVGVPLSIFNPNERRSWRFAIRINRPRSHDYNPLHRDGWLSHYHGALNLFVPVSACNERSSLPVVPGSHRWNEAELYRSNGPALMNGLRYSVPAITGATRPMRLVRPNPGHNEVLVFSSSLVHGLAKNFNADATRTSLEMRLWRRA